MAYYANKGGEFGGAPREHTGAPVPFEKMPLAGFQLEQRIDEFACALKRAVRVMREEARFQQIELAEELNVRPSVISRLESPQDPRRPTFPTLLRIATACGYQLEVLLRKVQSDAPPRLHVETGSGWATVEAGGVKVAEPQE